MEVKKHRNYFTILLLICELNMKGSFRKKKGHTTVASFVDKLARMLDNPQHLDIISWVEEGDAFVIKSVTRLIEEVLPEYFKHQNFSSFIRQLNMYNFNKVRRSQGDHVYANEHFKRDCKLGYKNIKRRGVEQKDDLILQQVNHSSMLMKQINEMNRKQKELESVIKHLTNDNQNLREQNKRLWKRVEKNLERSDKKLQKLMVFKLFGTQKAGGQAEDPAMIRQQNHSLSREIEMDPQQKTPRQVLANNLFSMLQKNKSSEEIRNLLKMCSDQKIPYKPNNGSKQVKNGHFEDPTLSIKHNGEDQQQGKSYAGIDDVNLFLDLETPPFDNQSQLI